MPYNTFSEHVHSHNPNLYIKYFEHKLRAPFYENEKIMRTRSGKIHKVKVNTEKMCTKLKKNDRFSTAGLTLDRYSKTLFFSSSYEYNGAKNFFAKSQELPK